MGKYEDLRAARELAWAASQKAVRPVTQKPVTEKRAVTDNLRAVVTEIAPRKRGRPKKADAPSAAERMRQMRAKRRAKA